MKQYEKLQTDMQQNLSIDEISGYLFALKDEYVAYCNQNDKRVDDIYSLASFLDTEYKMENTNGINHKWIGKKRQLCKWQAV